MIFRNIAGPTFSQVEVCIVFVADWGFFRIYFDEKLSQDLVDIGRLLAVQVWILVENLQQVRFQVAPLV